jgi:hypothetical protein
MEVNYEFQWNPKVKSGLNRIPDDILYEMARQTLDRSYPLIPKSNIKNHAGTLRRSSISGGVRGSSGDYYIGSYTAYASSVWKMTNVNWTTPGTHNKWFARTLDRYGKTIIDSAIDKSWRKDM